MEAMRKEEEDSGSATAEAVHVFTVIGCVHRDGMCVHRDGLCVHRDGLCVHRDGLCSP